MEMVHLKQRMDWFHQSLDQFDGAKPVRFISPLTTISVTLDMLGAFEASVVPFIAYFLGQRRRGCAPKTVRNGLV